MPDVNDSRHHVLNFEFDPIFPGRNLLIKLGKKAFGVSGAENIVEQVVDSVKTWKDVFRKAGIPDKEIVQLKRSISS